MPERVTDKFIVAQVKRMQAEGMDIDVDGQYGKFRVTNKSGSRDISPRCSNREISDWLDAYWKGWDAGREKARHPATAPIAQVEHG